jgi:hypothetical protein
MSRNKAAHVTRVLAHDAGAGTWFWVHVAQTIICPVWDFPALIERERISHEEKWQNLWGEQRDRRRKDFDALVEKIQSAKDRDKSALMIELNSLP